MKMKVLANPEFFKTWGKLVPKDIKPTLSYKIKKLSDFLGEEHKKFNEIRNSIIEKYGKKDEKGETVVKEEQVEVSAEHKEAALKEIWELENIDLGAPPFLLDLQALEDTGKIQLSAQDIALLEDLLDFSNVK